MPEPVVAVLAPDRFRGVFDGSFWPGARIVHLGLPAPVRRGVDVYRVEERLRDGELGDPDVVLIVAPRSRSPRTAAPPAVVGATVVALVQANRPSDLDRWISARRALETAEPTAAVCAMGKSLFTEVGEGWIDALGDAGWQVDDWRARRISKTELCQRLAGGRGMVVYAGHGRGRGWSGYQALRWPQIEAVEATRPCGLVIALACDTLTRSRGIVAFGSRWVASGRGGAYLGWCGPLHIGPGMSIAGRMCEVVAGGGAVTAAGLLRRVARATTDPAELRELRRLRLIGDPLTPLWTPKGGPERRVSTGVTMAGQAAAF